MHVVGRNLVNMCVHICGWKCKCECHRLNLRADSQNHFICFLLSSFLRQVLPLAFSFLSKQDWLANEAPYIPFFFCLSKELKPLACNIFTYVLGFKLMSLCCTVYDLNYPNFLLWKKWCIIIHKNRIRPDEPINITEKYLLFSGAEEEIKSEAIIYYKLKISTK